MLDSHFIHSWSFPPRPKTRKLGYAYPAFAEIMVFNALYQVLPDTYERKSLRVLTLIRVS